MLYIAVGPRKRIELKRGMEIKQNSGAVALVVNENQDSKFPVDVIVQHETRTLRAEECVAYRWPNGDGTWLPVEGEPEIISMEGVE